MLLEKREEFVHKTSPKYEWLVVQWLFISAPGEGIYRFPRWLSGKKSTCQWRRHRFYLWVRKIPWRSKKQPTPVFLPGKSHGQRSLVTGHRSQWLRHDWACTHYMVTCFTLCICPPKEVRLRTSFNFWEKRKEEISLAYGLNETNRKLG